MLVIFTRISKYIKNAILTIKYKKAFKSNSINTEYGENIFYLNGLQILYSIYIFNFYHVAIEHIIQNNMAKRILYNKLTYDIYLNIYSWYCEDFAFLIFDNESIIMAEDENASSSNKVDLQDSFFDTKSNEILFLFLNNYLLLNVNKQEYKTQQMILLYLINLYFQNLIDLIFIFEYNYIYNKHYHDYNYNSYNECIDTLINIINFIYTNQKYLAMDSTFLFNEYYIYKANYYKFKNEIKNVEYENLFIFVNNFHFNRNYIDLYFLVYFYKMLLESFKMK